MNTTMPSLPIRGQKGVGDTRIRHWPFCVVAALLLLILVPAAWGQSYLFHVPELRLQVFVQPDASARLVYDITYENLGQPIDIVDIGLPHGGFDLNGMQASINGVQLPDIRYS